MPLLNASKKDVGQPPPWKAEKYTVNGVPVPAQARFGSFHPPGEGEAATSKYNVKEQGNGEGEGVGVLVGVIEGETLIVGVTVGVQVLEGVTVGVQVVDGVGEGDGEGSGQGLN